jgi:hypothetical protein
MTHSRTRTALVFLMISGGPVLLGLDLLIHRLLFSGQPEEVRATLGALATTAGWCVIPGPLLGGALGFWLYPRFYRRQLGQRPSLAPERAASEAELMALMVCASLPQLPALLGDLCVMLGGRLLPALLSTTISTAAVLGIALLGPRRLAAGVALS